jgi:hypothetical protein
VTWVVGAFGVLVAALGGVGALAPGRLLDVVAACATPAGVWALAALRLALGVCFLLAAPASRAPGVLRVLGGVSLLSAVATPFFGVAGMRRLIAWWRDRSEATIRVWSLFVVGFGAALVYAVL